MPHAITLDSISNALNLKDLSEEEQNQLLLDIGDVIYQGSLVRLIERMDDKTRQAFIDLLDKGASEEVVEAYIAKHVPNADKAVEETVQDLANDILLATKE